MMHDANIRKIETYQSISLSDVEMINHEHVQTFHEDTMNCNGTLKSKA